MTVKILRPLQRGLCRGLLQILTGFCAHVDPAARDAEGKHRCHSQMCFSSYKAQPEACSPSPTWVTALRTTSTLGSALNSQCQIKTNCTQHGRDLVKLAPLSEDLHRENGGLTVLRTSKHLRELFPSTMPIVLFSCSVTSNISLVFIADRQKSSSSKDFLRRFF